MLKKNVPLVNLTLTGLALEVKREPLRRVCNICQQKLLRDYNVLG